MAQLIGGRDGGDQAAATLPIACTLEAREGAERATRWKTLLTNSVLELKREPDRIVIGVVRAPGIAAELGALVAAERTCCPFVEWRLGEHEGRYELQIRGTSEGLDAITGLFQSD